MTSNASLRLSLRRNTSDCPQRILNCLLVTPARIVGDGFSCFDASVAWGPKWWLGCYKVKWSGSLYAGRQGTSYFNQRAFPDNFRMADNRIQSLMGDWD